MSLECGWRMSSPLRGTTCAWRSARNASGRLPNRMTRLLPIAPLRRRLCAECPRWLALWLAAALLAACGRVGVELAAVEAGVDNDAVACAVGCESRNGTALCEGTSCTVVCQPGYADCDGDGANGCEVAVASSVDDCGACGNVCRNEHGERACVAGVCLVSCKDAYLDCDGDGRNGCETDALLDPNHCGACQTSCGDGQQCITGACLTSPCPALRASCEEDAQECSTDLASSTEHCGACGATCRLSQAIAGCEASRCTVASCENGYGDCDRQGGNGCEVELASALDHCGACGVGCRNPHGATACVGGRCAPTCNAGFADCDGNPNNGCEQTLDGLAHCGACGRSCSVESGLASCNGGVCGAPCDLTGAFAFKGVIPATWPATAALSAGSGNFEVWAKLVVAQRQGVLTGTLTTCGNTVPDFDAAPLIRESYGLSYPNVVFDRPPLLTTTTRGRLSALAPSADLSFERSALLMGVMLADPVATPWPERQNFPSVDGDGDGKPGVTGVYKNGLRYTPPPTTNVGAPRAEAAYLAARFSFALRGTLTSCSGSTGRLEEPRVDSRTLGCRIFGLSRDCLSNELTHLDENKPAYRTSAGTYQLVRMAGSASCADVRAALP